MNSNLGQDIKFLETGTSDEKIQILESLDSTDDFEIIKKMINCLDDPDIKVRGEAFASLILNKNNISNVLIENLNDERKNIRGFGALVLANRNDSIAIPKLIELTQDERSMVRSCALGALGHLKAKEAKDSIHRGLTDSNIEVKKSALQALIKIDGEISEKEISEILEEKDSEVEQLVAKLKKSGPEGI